MNRNEVAEQLRALAYDVERGKADANAILEFASQVQAPGIMFQWTAPEDPDDAHRQSLGIFKPGEMRLIRLDGYATKEFLGTFICNVTDYDFLYPDCDLRKCKLYQVPLVLKWHGMKAWHGNTYDMIVIEAKEEIPFFNDAAELIRDTFLDLNMEGVSVLICPNHWKTNPVLVEQVRDECNRILEEQKNGILRPEQE